jgi:mannose-1-phosphate guanylyltransferase/mannose-6-phosphate isomerase
MRNLVPVILSGGSGTRLWPASRKSLPKQFKKFSNIGTLFSQTLNRVKELNNCNNLTVVSAREYEFLINNEIERHNLRGTLILEELSKNTAAAIFFAAKGAFESSKNSILCIMPSDHWIPDFNKFKIVVEDSIKYAEHNWITYGIKPTGPSTGFGYIKVNDTDIKKIKNVHKFIEKPDLDKAKKFIESKSYYWNSGIFLVSAKKVLKSFDDHNKDVAQMLEMAWLNRHHHENRNIILKEFMEKLPSISIDKAIMEHEQAVKLVSYDGDWNDIGNWDSMNTLLSNYKNNNSNSMLIDCKNTHIQSSERLVVGIGLKDLTIVDEMDATLIFRKGEAEKVKTVVENLKQDNRNIADQYNFEYRPWGKFEVLLDSQECKVKKIIVDPFKSLSYQYHLKRSEHWTIVSGKADVNLDGIKKTYNVGESVVIPTEVKHSLANNSKDLLIIIEVQYGSYFGEDDIIRISDPYNR